MALIVTLTLFIQLIAVPYHQALHAPAFSASDAAVVAANSDTTLGDAACAHHHRKGAPLAPAGHCDDQCPFCQFAAQAAALVSPDAPAVPLRPETRCRTFVAASEFGAADAGLTPANRARAPPLAV